MNKADKNSTPMVVALLVILVGAIAITFARINPRSGRQAASEAAQAVAAQAGSGCVSVAPVGSLSRNPFRKPDAIAASKAEQSGGISSIVQENFVRPVDAIHLEAMPVNGLPTTPDAAVGEDEIADNDADGQDKQAPKPEFDLLATVGGSQGMCAVIRGAGSNTIVVGVGDVIEGGFTVQKIEKGRAVLKNGVDIVVVTRPG
jgi:hypothetical protein